MKRIASLTYLLIFVFLLSACTNSDHRSDGVLLASFAKDHGPAQMVKTGTHWVYLINAYGSQTYDISVSAEPEQLHSVYTADNVFIRFLEANDHYIVWCERSETTYTYKVYSIVSGTTETFFTTDASMGHQLQNVGVYESNVYYAFMDHASQKADIYRYDPMTKQRDVVYSPAYHKEISIMSFSVADGLMSVASPSGIVLIDLSTEEIVSEDALPKDVSHVFAISYDSANHNFALYYSDADSEDIGLLKPGETSISSVFTFGSNHYAHHDTIQCADGHIYWVNQANASGNITDHYVLIDYDYIRHQPLETSRTIDFFVDAQKTYYLRFDQDGNYQNIEVYQQ